MATVIFLSQVHPVHRKNKAASHKEYTNNSSLITQIHSALISHPKVLPDPAPLTHSSSIKPAVHCRAKNEN